MAAPVKKNLSDLRCIFFLVIILVMCIIVVMPESTDIQNQTNTIIPTQTFIPKNTWKKVKDKTFYSDSGCSITMISQKIIQGSTFVSCELIPTTDDSANEAFDFLLQNIPKDCYYLKVLFFDKKREFYSQKSWNLQKTPIPPLTFIPQPASTPIISVTSELNMLSGYGDSVVNINKKGGRAIAHIKYTGDENFIVWNYGMNGERINLLVNTVGNYEGTCPLDFNDGENTVRFQIQASGKWTIQILPLDKMHVIKIPGRFDGRGDDVIYLEGGNPDTLQIDASRARSSNFIIWGYNDYDYTTRNLLVNSIAPYTGTVLMQDSKILVIQAVGIWSIGITTIIQNPIKTIIPTQKFIPKNTGKTVEDKTFHSDNKGIMNFIILIIVLATSIWVLIDAKTIGVKKGQIKGIADMGPWGWFFVCLLLWIIGFPFYLIKREEYKRINFGG